MKTWHLELVAAGSATAVAQSKSEVAELAVSSDGSTFFDGLSIDNASGIVDQPRLPRFKAYTNYDNYVGVGAWTKIGLNNTDNKDQGVLIATEI